MKIKSIRKIEYETPVPVYDVINAYPYNNFFIKTKDSYIVSHNSKIMEIYTNIRRRMESRFMVQGKCYGLLVFSSSKSTENAFLEAYIEDQKKKGYPIYVVDQPLWKVKPSAYSGQTFKVAVGNKYLPSKVLPLDYPISEIDQWVEGQKKLGLNVIDVPVEHRQAFDQNIDKALQDIAGISTAVTTKAFSGERVLKCVDDKLLNPFRTEVVSLGLSDPLRLQDFFDESVIPDNVKGAPIFIHLDTSLTGDRTGLSGVAIVGTKESKIFTSSPDREDQELTSEELVCQLVFTVGIQPPSDSEISFEKTRQFIYYLKDHVGLNIKLVSSDGFQSSDMRQILSTKGYKVKYTSLDRTPDGYDSLRSAINDHRIIIPQGCNELINELTELNRDNITREYDHDSYHRKDQSDSFAGAYWDAIQYKDEYLYFRPDQTDYEAVNIKSDPAEDLRKGMLSSIKTTNGVSVISNEDYFDSLYGDDSILF